MLFSCRYLSSSAAFLVPWLYRTLSLNTICHSLVLNLSRSNHRLILCSRPILLSSATPIQKLYLLFGYIQLFSAVICARSLDNFQIAEMRISTGCCPRLRLRFYSLLRPRLTTLSLKLIKKYLIIFQNKISLSYSL